MKRFNPKTLTGISDFESFCSSCPLHLPSRWVGYVDKAAVTNFSIFQNRKKDMYFERKLTTAKEVLRNFSHQTIKADFFLAFFWHLKSFHSRFVAISLSFHILFELCRTTTKENNVIFVLFWAILRQKCNAIKCMFRI